MSPEVERLRGLLSEAADTFLLPTEMVRRIVAALAAAPEPPEVDPLDLLRRYIEHVGECEGSVFLRDWNRKFSKVEFSDAEWALLQELDR